MGIESNVNAIADLNPKWPTGSEFKSGGDDHLRLLKRAVVDSFAGMPGAVIVSGVDGGAVNAYTLTPPEALPEYSPKMLMVFAPTVTNTGPVTMNMSGLGVTPVKSVSGAALAANDLVAGMIYLAIYTGSEFRLTAITKRYADSLAFSSALPGLAAGFLGSPDGAGVGFTQTHTGYAQKEVRGADIASAGTINLTTATGNFVHVTGNAAIAAITIPVGAEFTAVFDSALTLMHGAGLLLPGAANIAVAAGDRMVVRGDAAGANVIAFTRANGQAVVAPAIVPPTVQPLGSATVSAAVATINFLTAFSGAYDRYTIDIQGMKGASTAMLQMRLAIAGAADAGASSYTTPINSTTNPVLSAGSTIDLVNPLSTGAGASLIIDVLNANVSGAGSKTVNCRGAAEFAAAQYANANSSFVHRTAGVLTGFQLFMATGDIVAGTVRIYGHRNT